MAILKWMSLPALALTALISLGPAFSQNGEPGFSQGEQGASGGGEPGVSSPGFEGMPDTESTYLADVKKAEKKGKRSQAYIGSLLALGMHYNRANRPGDATRVLRQALFIIDSGALKPTPASQRKPEKIIEHHSGDTVSAEVIRQPLPYEETLSELLPQLITAEMGINDLKLAEAHCKRLLALAGANQVIDKMSQISAYMSYAEICRRQHRMKEAQLYQRKADEINASFKPL